MVIGVFSAATLRCGFHRGPFSVLLHDAWMDLLALVRLLGLHQTVEAWPGGHAGLLADIVSLAMS